MLSTKLEFDLTPTSGNFHALGGGIYYRDPCYVDYVVTNTDNSLFTISGNTGIIGQKWVNDPSTITGADVSDTYTGWTVEASYTNY